MSRIDPLAHARGLGSGKTGVEHWWLQRLSAVLLLPLSLWFFWAVAPWLRADYADARSQFAQPVAAFLLMVFLLASIYHAVLGLQVVIEDYVHDRAFEVGAQVVVKLAAWMMALGVVFCLIRITLGA